MTEDALASNLYGRGELSFIFCVWKRPTLRASFSGTFFQTLPDLVTPLNGHSLSPRRMSTDAVGALRNVWVLITLRAPFPGTFLVLEGRMS